MDAEFVWVRDPAQVWLLVKADFAADGSGSLLATLSDGANTCFKPGEFFPSNPKLLQGIDDLTGLQHLDEPNILHNLSIRFHQDKIYSFTGPILVAVNPWKRLPLYSSAVLLNYLGRSRSQCPPHVFAIAEAAYRAMVNYDRDQSVLVSGESGAGKTETTKFVMQYLTALSGGAACSSSSSIERQVLESNPLLEAFGNAKTIRNDNSSRFGKFIRIGFDANGRLITAQIETYLLEKSRVTYVAAAERSYHVFYQLCAVAVHARGDVEMESSLLQMFRSLQLGSSSDYAMLNRNECVRTVDGVDDLQSFFRMAEAMATINLSPDSLSDVCRIIAAILHLSNVNMVAVASSAGTDSSTIAHASAPSVQIVSSLIGCSPEAISKALCFRSIKTNEEIVTVPNTKVQAVDTRDALCKALYGRLFDWIVARINESFTSSASQQKNFIGILDIFGFEFFETNSFEQLCINYANEMLQNQFNAFVFQLEQIEYGTEGIPWSLIEFFDNKPCLEAIGGKGGSVLACLDEECLVPAGSDSGFCSKVRAIKNKFLKAPPKNQASFTVCHYAGEVEYTSFGFLDKNRDSLASDVSEMLTTSTSLFVSGLFYSAKRDKRGSLKSAAGAKKGQMSQPTLGAQFQKSLLALMDIIVKTQPHYVRCITPNSHKKPGEVNNARVVQQLQCSGVIEAVRVTRAGFPSRFLYSDFIKRYRVISPASCNADATQSCTALLAAAGLEVGASVQMGKTKLFLKLAAVDSLDKRRSVALGVYATKFNRCVRGWLCRVTIRKWRTSIAALSWFLVRNLRFRAWQRDRQESAAVSIQVHVRCSLKSRLFSLFVSSCQLLQSRARSQIAVGRHAAARRHHAASALQSRFRTLKASTFHRSLKQRISVCQRAARCWSARRALKDMKVQARDVSNLRQQKADLEIVVADLKRDLCSEGEFISQLKLKIEALEKENFNLQAAASSPVGGASNAASDVLEQLEAAHARCSELETQLTAAHASLQELQKLYDDSRNDVAAAQTEAASARSELDKVQADLSVAQLQHERLSVASARLAAAAAQSPTATSFYKAQASPVTHDPTVEPVAAASMNADAIPRRSSQDKSADGNGSSLLEKGQHKFQAKRSAASPPFSPQMSAAPPHTPLSAARGSFSTSSADAADLHISMQSVESAEDALASIRALMHGNISGTQNQHSHAEVLSFVKSLCSEVAVLRRVVTNTERAGAGGGSGSMSSPRTPRSTNSFMPFMPKSPVIPSDAAIPERLRMVEEENSVLKEVLEKTINEVGDVSDEAYTLQELVQTQAIEIKTLRSVEEELRQALDKAKTYASQTSAALAQLQARETILTADIECKTGLITRFFINEHAAAQKQPKVEAKKGWFGGMLGAASDEQIEAKNDMKTLQMVLEKQLQDIIRYTNELENREATIFRLLHENKTLKAEIASLQKAE